MTDQDQGQDVPPLSPQALELRMKAEIADSLERFLGSAAGKNLCERAQADMDTAFSKFLELDPMNAEAVRAVQNRAIVAEQALAYIRDAIVEGDQAKTAMETERFTD